MFFWFCQRSPAKMPAHQIITLKQMKKHMFFLEITKNVKVTIFISVSRLLYLTDPIHSTKRYNNLNGFRDILGLSCPTRGLLEGPGLDSDTFIIRESSGNHPGSAGLPGLAGLAGRSRILWFINKNRSEIDSQKKKKKKQTALKLCRYLDATDVKVSLLQLAQKSTHA